FDCPVIYELKLNLEKLKRTPEVKAKSRKVKANAGRVKANPLKVKANAQMRKLLDLIKMKTAHRKFRWAVRR
ncbi:hypothetical protein, partial [Sporolactobacillus inulinus]|uniref:hypothetical protein n=1 Tax=Sporolactobacillus inulinus TaxID=2078 RepID=UPI001C3F5C6F